MHRILVAILAFYSGAGLGCECALLDWEGAKQARHVFAFKANSMRIDAENEALIHGEIQVLETFRGNGAEFHSLRTHVGRCCATSLVVGVVYYAFTNEDGPTLTANAGSVLAFPHYETATEVHGIARTTIEKLLHGEDMLEVFWLNSWRTLSLDSWYICSEEEKRGVKAK